MKCGTKQKEDKTMKKLKKFISRIRELENWAALLMAGAAMMFTACSSSSDDSIIEQPTNPTEPKVYTMTVQASKGDGVMTRALSLDGTTLNATWTAGDEVTVTKESGGVSTQVTPPSWPEALPACAPC